MIIYLNKKIIKDNHFIEIFYNGVTALVKCSSTFFDSCKYQPGQQLNDALFDVSYYKKGYDNILSLKLK